MIIIIIEAEDDKIDYTSNRDFKSIEILKNKMLLKIGRLIINLFKRVWIEDNQLILTQFCKSEKVFKNNIR